MKKDNENVFKCITPFLFQKYCSEDGREERLFNTCLNTLSLLRIWQCRDNVTIFNVSLIFIFKNMTMRKEDGEVFIVLHPFFFLKIARRKDDRKGVLCIKRM